MIFIHLSGQRPISHQQDLTNFHRKNVKTTTFFHLLYKISNNTINLHRCLYKSISLLIYQNMNTGTQSHSSHCGLHYHYQGLKKLR